MKTLATIFALGISLLSYAQETNNQSTLVELDDVVIASVNTNYLNTVQDEYTPKEVSTLQREVASYDVQSNSEFSEDVTITSFEMAFRNTKGSIDAFYNKQGKIEAAFERFHNILLPRTIQRKLYQAYKGWTMTGNLYACSYEGDQLINRSYKILLEKGDHKKSVVIHARQ